MPFNALPQAFYGPGIWDAMSGFALLANTVNALEHSVVSVDTATDEIELGSGVTLGIRVGDKLLYNASATAPVGLTDNTVYYVQAVDTATDKIKLAATLGGAAINITGGETGTDVIQFFSPLLEVATSEADIVTGDWRKMFYGFLEMHYQRWLLTPTADRPVNITCTRSSSTNEVTNKITRYYNFSVVTDLPSLEVSAEP